MELRDRLNLGADWLRSGITRRDLMRAGVAGTAALSLAPLLAACGGSDDATATKGAGGATATTGGNAATTPTAATAGGGSPTTAGSSPTSGGGAAATATTGETAAPTATAGSTGAAGKGGKLINGRSNDSDSLDPQRTIASASWYIFSNIFDSLVTQNVALEFEPIIAEKYEISDDGITYTFNIRDGIKFHDGSDVTAADVKYTFDRATTPDAPSQAVSFISALKQTDLPDDKTVVMTLSEPSAPYLANIAVEYFGIMPQAAVEAAGDDFGTQPVGSGPWKFKEWIQGEQITLEPFADYQNFRSFVENTGAPRADALISKVIPEAQTLLAAFETGEINHLTLPTQEVKNYDNNPDYHVLIAQGGTGISYIEYAMVKGEGEEYEPQFKPPFDDLKLRQAMAYGVDADEIITGVLAGLSTRNYGIMPTGLFAYDPDIEQFGYHFDADKANSLLDEAGWAMGSDNVRAKDGKTLELAFWAFVDPSYEKAVQVIQNQLGKVGIKLNLSVLDVGTMLAQLPQNQQDANIMGYGWPEPDILKVIAEGTWGFSFYHKKEYIDLINQARTVTDHAQRTQMYFEAQKIALADAVVVPLWTDPAAIIGIRDQVKGYKLGPQGVDVWTDAWVE
jgi:peptide/nickel transport system substrate-binding protein